MHIPHVDDVSPVPRLIVTLSLGLQYIYQFAALLICEIVFLDATISIICGILC